MILQYILLISTNLIFQASRTYNTRAIAKEDSMWKIIWTSLVVKLSWIVSTSIGIKSIFDGDFWLATTYIITGVIGDYLGMKIKYTIKTN